MSFVNEYKALGPAPEKTVRFFDRRDFLTVYGDDANFIAQTFNKTTATVRTVGEGDAQLAAQTVSRRLLPAMLKRLVLEMGYSYEVWAQAGKGGAWAVQARGSPGNFDVAAVGGADDDGDAAAGGLMVALQLGSGGGGGVTAGLAYVDQLALVLGMHDWLEADTAALSGVEAALVQLGARECLVPSAALAAHPQLRAMLARADVVLTERKAAQFRADCDGDLARLLLPAHAAQLAAGGAADALARGACGALLRELDVLAETGAHGRYKLDAFARAAHMRLDAAAVRALGLLPSASDGARSAAHVFGRLNACRTAMGTRRLLAWLRAPALDVALIARRHDCVAALVADAAAREALRGPALRAMPDVQRLLARFARSKATLADVLRLYQAVQGLPAVAAALGAPAAPLQATYGAAVARMLAQFANLCNMVEATLDLDALADDGSARIRPSFDEQLQELHGHMARAMRDMKSELERARAIAPKTELEQRRGAGWVLRAAKKDAAALVAGLEGAEAVAGAAGAHCVATARLRRAGDAHAKLARQYDDTQAALVAQLLDVVRGYAPLMEELAAVLADLDVFAALAHVAASAPVPWVRPQMVAAGGDTLLTAMRHPCLELQDGLRYVANDVRFVRGERELLLVTGPNMGGKSTHIRACALTVLLAQTGSFVPCRAAQVAVADALLCRVGAGDSLVRGVSTFMAEMAETAHLLRVATPHSLLIVDELGRGTSTYDGFGLAMAIAEHVATKLRCFCFFATHFHELTHLSHRIAWVGNQHVAAHAAQGALTLLYEVREGPCDQSFGIHVAELAGFPARVVAMARRKARQLETFDTAVKRHKADGDAADDDAADGAADEAERRAGETHMVNFLEAVKAAGPDVPMEQLERLRAELFAHGNAYVRSVLQRAQ